MTDAALQAADYMQERPVVSVGCDLGPAAQDPDELSSPNGYARAKLRFPRLSEGELIGGLLDHAAPSPGPCGGAHRERNDQRHIGRYP